MLVYIAAPGTQGDRAQWLAARLREAGHQVVSTWHRNGGPLSDPTATLERIAVTAENSSQIRSAQVVVGYMPFPDTAKEAHRELGYARALEKPVIEWVSDDIRKRAISDSCGETVRDIDELLAWLGAMGVTT